MHATKLWAWCKGPMAKRFRLKSLVTSRARGFDVLIDPAPLARRPGRVGVTATSEAEITIVDEADTGPS